MLIGIMLLVSMEMYHLNKSKFTPQRLSEDVQQNFQFRDHSALNDYKSGLFDAILKDSQNAIPSVDYFFFIVRNNTTVLWNTTEIDLPEDLESAPEEYSDGIVKKLRNGYYYLQTWPVTSASTPSGDCYAVSVIPISFEYPIENQYFKSHFASNDHIPDGVMITEEAIDGAFPIINIKGRPVCYLSFTQTVDAYFVADGWTWFVSILLCLIIVFWIHEFCYGIGLRTGKPLMGFLALLVFMVPVYLFVRFVQYPAGFQNSGIFSPELYYPSEGVKSLGNLLMLTLMESWAFIYVVSYISLKEVPLVKNKRTDKLLRIFFVVLILAFLYAYFLNDIANLITDSKISFETGNFFNLNFYTFVGIFTIAVITINFLVLLTIVNKLLHGVTNRFWRKLLLLLGLSAAVMYVLFYDDFKSLHLVVLFMSLLAFILPDRFGLPMRKRKNYYDLSIATSTYIWFAILCSWVTLEIFYFNYSKELELRKVFARKQEQKDDGNTAFRLMGMMGDLKKDSLVYAYFKDIQDPEKKDDVSNYINYVYLNDFFKKFDIDLYFYDKARNPVWQTDTIGAFILKYSDSVTKTTFREGLIDVESLRGGDYIYWFMSPYQFAGSGDTLGYIGFVIFADKRYKKNINGSFFEINSNPTDQQYYDRYSYAIYHDRNIWTQYGDIVFPYYLTDTLKGDNPQFINNDQYSSALLYPTEGDEVIKVVYQRNILVNIVSLFSYVLALLLLVSGLIFLLRYFLFYPGRIRSIYKNFSFTIRSKVNITILVTVSLSLFIVGFITLSFLKNRYDNSQKENLQGLLNSYSGYVNNYMEGNKLKLNEMSTAPTAAYSGFSYALNKLAEQQGADVNIYNKEGNLIASSQLDIYRKGMLSRHLGRSVMLNLKWSNSDQYIRTEHLGKLHYQSICAPLRDDRNNVAGYIDIPYYASGKELKDEFSNVIITLINVYALVFFLSGLCAIFISNSIIRAFRVLIDQFRNIRLHHNEYIHWPYRDEIALLVNEYNAMMRKVETMATRLARTEREAAWRDIAMQVAHEIKNPLTPMKLNIQYLQQAILAGRPDIEKLASKVSGVLIEQIENLNIIASEFSNFAKMPDAFPQNLPVYKALQALIALFQKNNEIKIELLPSDDSLAVYIDKSYFIRIITNLLQNAMQSIQEEKQGHIKISYEQIDANVVIVIEDNGSGIPEEVQDKLFQPYFTTKTSGTGLGLPMTKSLVENSDGSIWFKTNPNGGSRFFVRLPAGEAE